MDAVFAVLVLGAVIFFGALISVGNERQRKALDGIREQTALWAVQDLRIKREHLVREVRVDDPIGWLNQVIARATGEDLGLSVSQVFDNPHALVCAAGDAITVAISPASPRDIRRFHQTSKSKLSRVGNIHPLLNLSRNTEILELSVLNGGLLFDLELEIAWRKLTGRDAKNIEKLWMYKIQ